MKFWNSFAVPLLLLLSATSWAFPQAPLDNLHFKPNKAFFSGGYDFSGIVKLSNCSGSLVIFEGESFEARAKVLTNGHCVTRGFLGGMIRPNEVIVNKNVKMNMGLFKDLRTRFTISATKIIYATMTDTDLALYELSETYQQILARTSVAPLVLSSQRPVEGTEIEIISGYWERGYSCAIDAFIHQLQEGNYFFKDSIRYTPGCETIGGTSGSPILDVVSREVIGVNNTANETGRKCTNNNPCEVDERGNVTVLRGRKYGQQTYNIYTCLNAQKEFSLTQKGCVLPK